VVGFDDVVESAYCRPALTTLAARPREIGEAAATLLLHRIKAPDTRAERIKGGREFAKVVADVRGRPNRSRIVAIAHSHGGNVVAYGGRDVPPDAQADAMVTLGTPFLDLSARHLEPYFRILDICLHGLVLAALVVPLLVISHFIWPRIPRGDGADRTASFAARQVLAVSVRFDEAGWLLRSVDAIAQLPFMVLVLIGLPAALTVLAFVVVYGFVDSGVGWYFILRAPDAFGAFVARAASYAFVALLGSTGLFLLFQIVVVGLPQVRKIGFFGESIADYALVRIATAIVPPGTGAAWVARYAHVRARAETAGQAGWLRHSAIDNDPDIIADVAAWVVDGAMPSRATSVTHAPTAAAAAGDESNTKRTALA